MADAFIGALTALGVWLFIVVILIALAANSSNEDLQRACGGQAKVVSVDHHGLFNFEPTGLATVVCSDGRVVTVR